MKKIDIEKLDMRKLEIAIQVDKEDFETSYTTITKEDRGGKLIFIRAKQFLVNEDFINLNMKKLKEMGIYKD